MEGSTFLPTCTIVRTVFRENAAGSAPELNPGAAVREWEATFAMVLRALSHFPEAYAAVQQALKLAEMSP